jgi:hypothetical protein
MVRVKDILVGRDVVSFVTNRFIKYRGTQVQGGEVGNSLGVCTVEIKQFIR